MKGKNIYIGIGVSIIIIIILISLLICRKREGYKNTYHIPKIIHQVYINSKSSNLPENIKNNIKQIKLMNPGWEHRIYTVEDINTYIKKNYPDLFPLYTKINIKYGAARVDFFRYLLLYKEGGVYLDIKSCTKKPLSKVLKKNDEFILSNTIWDRSEYKQWFIISRPKHPFLKKTIENVVKNIINYNYKRDGVGKKGVFKLTGPTVYTNSITEVKNKGKYRFVRNYGKLGLKFSCISNRKKGYVYKHYKKLREPIVHE